MKALQWLLFPLSALYGYMMKVRNKQFDEGRRPVVDFEPVIISVGNLSVGGTGKTPMIEYLIRFLMNDFKLATISRGYGRKTKGFRLAKLEDTARTLGDEPLQFYRKFGDQIHVTVCEERILAVPNLLHEHEDTELFLLDDAYQHRKIGRDLNILLTDFAKPFYEDFVVPTGRLREERKGAGRADLVIVTKCPVDLSTANKEEMTRKVREYNGEVPVFFSFIHYDAPQRVFGNEELSKQVSLITGLANSSAFISAVEQDYEVLRHFDFGDHYAFRKADLDKIERELLKNVEKPVLLTTEKDMVRLLSFQEHSLFQKAALYYIPIRFELDRPKEFETLVLKVIDKKKKEV